MDSFRIQGGKGAVVYETVQMRAIKHAQGPICRRYLTVLRTVLDASPNTILEWETVKELLHRILPHLTDDARAEIATRALNDGPKEGYPLYASLEDCAARTGVSSPVIREGMAKGLVRWSKGPGRTVVRVDDVLGLTANVQEASRPQTGTTEDPVFNALIESAS